MKNTNLFKLELELSSDHLRTYLYNITQLKLPMVAINPSLMWDYFASYSRGQFYIFAGSSNASIYTVFYLLNINSSKPEVLIILTYSYTQKSQRQSKFNLSNNQFFISPHSTRPAPTQDSDQTTSSLGKPLDF